MKIICDLDVNLVTKTGYATENFRQTCEKQGAFLKLISPIFKF